MHLFLAGATAFIESTIVPERSPRPLATWRNAPHPRPFTNVTAPPPALLWTQKSRRNLLVPRIVRMKNI